MFNMTTPITLPDDGMRLVKTGETKSGGYRYVVEENPELIAAIVSERRYRRHIYERNFALTDYGQDY